MNGRPTEMTDYDSVKLKGLVFLSAAIVTTALIYRLSLHGWTRPTSAVWSSGPSPGSFAASVCSNFTRLQLGSPKKAQPQLCVALVSCKRPQMLRRTLSALQAALAAEPGVAAEVHWVDNGTPAVERNALLAAYGQLLTSAVLHDTNCGVFGALNLLFFTLCGAAPYVLVLEEDWVAVPRPAGAPLRRAMDVLAADGRVGSVFLRTADWPAGAAGEDGWRMSPNGTEYRRHCPAVAGWGAYTNGASLMRQTTLRAAGLLPVVGGSRWDPEFMYSKRFAAAGLCAAELRLTPACEHTVCNSAFEHIGGDNSSAGWLEFGASRRLHAASLAPAP